MSLEAIILAAGTGSRMHSSLPKSLHLLGGLPMLAHIAIAAHEVGAAKIHIVVAGDGAAVKSGLSTALGGGNNNGGGEKILAKIDWISQSKPLGTGDAARLALAAVDKSAMVLVLYGDTPLVDAATLEPLIAAQTNAQKNLLALLTAEYDNPTGLGRIVRDGAGAVMRIIEEKDADAETRKIRECNTGFIAASASLLAAALAKLDNNNAQGEFYLTDVVAHAKAAGADIVACRSAHPQRTVGVNSHAELARAERIYQFAQAEKLLADGVRLRDPARFDVRGRCRFGRDCTVDVNVILEGDVVVGARCSIGAGALIRNSRIGDDCVIEANCVIDDADIGAGCVVGPFARLRPQTRLDANARIGNFVEIKKSRIGQKSKVNHLSYVGDSEVGHAANIGAGVITCNYDGIAKHPTKIGDRVFIGSNSQLVAPLTIGDGATIGAGSTITKDVAAGALAVERAKQIGVADWTRGKDKSDTKTHSGNSGGGA